MHKFILALTLAPLLFLVACKTTEVVTIQPDGTTVTNIVKKVDVDRVARIAGDTAEVTTVAWLGERPEDEIYFRAALVGLNELIQDENYDPKAFAKVLDILPVQQLQSTEAKLAYASGRIIVREAFHEVGTLIEGQELIHKTLLSVRDGLQRGLSSTAPPGLPPTSSYRLDYLPYALRLRVPNPERIDVTEFGFPRWPIDLSESHAAALLQNK